MILAILQARMSSTRLPGKVLLPILEKPMLLHQIERIQKCKNINDIIVATSIDQSDDAIEKMCNLNGVKCYRGSLNNVLDRYYRIAEQYKPKHIVRLTGDCPLSDYEVIDNVIKRHLKNGNDYTSNSIEPTFPDGLDVEVFTFESLLKVMENANRISHQEHVTLYINENPTQFKRENHCNYEDLSQYRLTVDEKEDYTLVCQVYEALYNNNNHFLLNDIITFLKQNKELLMLNKYFQRNEGLQKSLNNDVSFFDN